MNQSNTTLQSSTSPLTAANKVSAWEDFILRHTHPGNLALHFVSMLMFYGSPVALLLTQNHYWCVPFFLSGLVGTGGHYLFRDGGVSVKESTSSPTVVFFVLIMFYKIARGTYFQEIAQAKQKQGPRQ